jgi:hypothetical protein
MTGFMISRGGLINLLILTILKIIISREFGLEDCYSLKLSSLPPGSMLVWLIHGHWKS